MTFTFSEPMSPESILAGWSGLATNVTVRFTKGTRDVVLTVYDAANSTALALGSVAVIKRYVTANTVFTASTMVLSANTISITLGTASGSPTTATGNSALRWTTSTAATDRAGNPLALDTVDESGGAGLDF